MEIWKDIVGYEGIYQISNLGNVKSLGKQKGFIYQKEKYLKLLKHNNGYSIINLYLKRIKHTKTVHRLVAQEFIPNPDNKPQVNHINGIKTDNRLENLEWCTVSENEKHKYKVLGYKSNAYGKFGKYNKTSKKVNQYTKNLEFIKTWDCMKDVERTLNIASGSITNCCKGKLKTAGGFIWKYCIGTPELNKLKF